MKNIKLLDNETIDKIAAGEVIERPMSIVKELVENAIDAKATIITVEIKDGGMKLIRVTDNGTGIQKEQVQSAFLRHATSKIKEANDLFQLTSLGFRGEALSSIAAVSETEVITKTKNELTGVRYEVIGGKAGEIEEVGAPSGTTFLIRNLFFNTPVRKKFLKSPTTEGSQIYSLMEHLALSKPQIAFTFIINGKIRLQTVGNGDTKQVIYRIFGKNVLEEVFYKEEEEKGFLIQAYLGTPALNRGTRGYENLFVNGRYVQSEEIELAIESAYSPFLMKHKFPFALLYITCNSEVIDVNIHPSKKEVRFNNQSELSKLVERIVREGIENHSLIRETKFKEENKQKEEKSLYIRKDIAEPFEENHRKKMCKHKEEIENILQEESTYFTSTDDISKVQKLLNSKKEEKKSSMEQITLFSEEEIKKQEKEQYRIIGQVFDTYWIVTLADKLYFIDQHAAHEKVKYERFINQLEQNNIISQNVNPPIVVTLTANEKETLNQYEKYFFDLGFVIEEFGGNEYTVREIPTELFGNDALTFFQDVLDELSKSNIKGTPIIIKNKIASMACKSAVKGNNTLNQMEMEALIRELMELENPFFCPHGRPTIISLTKKEVEKKFKRIL